MGNNILPTGAQLDALREILQIGAARASDAFRAIIGKPTAIELTKINFEPAEKTLALISPKNEVRVIVYVPIYGALGGHFFISMSEDAAGALETSAGIDKSSAELKQSFFEEIANIVANNYLRAVEPFVGNSSQQDIPSYTKDIPESVFDAVLAQISASGGYSLMGETSCSVENMMLDIDFLWFFNPGELTVLWDRIDTLSRRQK